MEPIQIATALAPANAVGIDECTPDALAALGPLLCLHDAADPHLLSGWSRAARLVATISLDSDGPTEALRFFDTSGSCCWRLHLLPDSDFHAWERLLASLPVEADRAASWRWLAPAWKRSAHRGWRACALRLHALPATHGSARLAATDVTLSSLGRASVQRLARQASAAAHAEPRGHGPEDGLAWTH